MNERLSIQQGLFLFPKGLEDDFEVNLCHPHEAANLAELGQKDGRLVVAKLVIPRKLHLEIIYYLSLMNISEATLFPGIEGYAKSQRMYIQLARLTAQRKNEIDQAIHSLAFGLL